MLIGNVLHIAIMMIMKILVGCPYMAHYNWKLTKNML